MKFIIRRNKRLPKFDPVLPLIKQLQERIKTARLAIKKVNGRLCGKKTPWLLLFGPKNSGKTTLLSRSGLDLISPHQQSLKTVKNTQAIDWWICSEGVFIDPAGKYCLAREGDEINQYLWQSFLRILKWKKRKPLFNAIILTVDYLTLSKAPGELDALADDMGAQLQTLLALGPIPLIVVITQCDRLDGFTHFFSDLESEDREQPLGFSLRNEDNLAFHELIKERSIAFINRISERLFWRLHHEQSLARRAQIKDVPIQFEKLIENLEQWLDRLLLDKKQLMDVYFTSSQQSDSPVNLLTQAVAKSFSLSEVKTYPSQWRQKPYFIQTFFKKLIENPPKLAAESTGGWQRRFIIYPVALIIILSTFGMWHHSYR